eukprot:9502844-Pyramimonas_sp.AAC.1
MSCASSGLLGRPLGTSSAHWGASFLRVSSILLGVSWGFLRASRGGRLGCLISLTPLRPLLG